MNIDKILIVMGEPKSTFTEILGKYFISKKYKLKNIKLIIIGNKNLFDYQMKKLNMKVKTYEIKKIDEAEIKKINFLNIKYKYKNLIKISSDSNIYISECFKKALSIIKNTKNIALINGPISKKYFLNKKYPGMTEYISKKTNSKNQVMLIYNENLSVSPVTTHLPLKNVVKHVTKQNIINNALKINTFYVKKLKKKPKIAILGLNPHCETNHKISEEEKIIIPSINSLKKKKLKVEGPFSADTFFLKKNLKKFDVVIGMYHDQVLTPLKTLYNFNAINITLGIPFLRVTPDHGPNIKMIGKNKSDPSSIIYAMKFFKNLNEN